VIGILALGKFEYSVCCMALSLLSHSTKQQQGLAGKKTYFSVRKQEKA